MTWGRVEIKQSPGVSTVSKKDKCSQSVNISLTDPKWQVCTCMLCNELPSWAVIASEM